MSHIIKKECNMKDTAAMKLAAEKLGIAVLENAVPRYYGTNMGGRESQPCDLVLQLPGRYDLGIQQGSDGAFRFVCDSELLTGNYGRSDQGRAMIGEHAENLMTAYGEAETELLLMSYGLAFTRSVDTVTGEVEYLTSDPREAGLLYS
jgi:hypothetical protein